MIEHISLKFQPELFEKYFSEELTAETQREFYWKLFQLLLW